MSQINQPAPSRQSSEATPPESLLIDHIQAHIKQGDKARERANKNREKAEQHFVAAGRYLLVLKTNYSRDWNEWESLLRIKVKLSTGRASELMQIADGRKDLQQIRDGKAQSVARLRANKSLHYSSEEKVDDADELFEEGPTTCPAAAPSPSVALVGIKTGHDPDSIIFALARSTPAERGAAVESLVRGSRQSQFEQVSAAVADLYTQLAKAGR
jgi:hypothetical protein